MPTPKRPQTRLLDKKPIMLAHFRACCSVTEAARRTGIDRSLHYSWLHEDADYAAQFAVSLDEARGTLTDSAVEWATVGLFEPTQFKGEFVWEQIPVLNPDGAPVLDANGARVYKRGKQFGIYRRDAGLLRTLMQAWIPEFKENAPDEAADAEPPAFVVNVEPKKDAK